LGAGQLAVRQREVDVDVAVRQDEALDVAEDVNSFVNAVEVVDLDFSLGDTLGRD